MDDDLDDLTLEYWRIVQCLRQMQLPGIDKAVVLAEIEEAYRRERAAKLGALLAQSPTKTCIADNTEQQANSFQYSGLVLRGFAHF